MIRSTSTYSTFGSAAILRIRRSASARPSPWLASTTSPPTDSVRSRPTASAWPLLLAAISRLCCCATALVPVRYLTMKRSKLVWSADCRPAVSTRPAAAAEPANPAVSATAMAVASACWCNLCDFDIRMFPCGILKCGLPASATHAVTRPHTPVAHSWSGVSLAGTDRQNAGRFQPSEKSRLQAMRVCAYARGRSARAATAWRFAGKKQEKPEDPADSEPVRVMIETGSVVTRAVAYRHEVSDRLLPCVPQGRPR